MGKSKIFTLLAILALMPLSAAAQPAYSAQPQTGAQQVSGTSAPEQAAGQEQAATRQLGTQQAAGQELAATRQVAGEGNRPLGAQESAAQPMTLKECMAYAISNSTKVRIQQAASDDARLNRRDAILGAFTPDISGSTYAYYNFGRAVDPATNTYVTTTSFHNSYDLSASIKLFDGFKAVNNMKITKTSIALGKSSEDQVEADICLATMEAYCNVLYYSKLADIYESQAEVAGESLKKAKRQEELGQKGHADVVEMNSNLADMEYKYVEAVNKLNDARITLEDVMFWSEDYDLTIDENLPSDIEGRMLTDGADTEDMVEFAQANNPAARIAKYNLLNARRELSTAKWQLLPTLGAYAGWSTTYYSYPGSGEVAEPFRTQFKNNGGEFVQLALSIPIFSGLKGHSNIARKKNAVAKASAEYDQKMRDISAEVRRAVQDRDGAGSAYVLAQRKADVQEEAYSLNMKKMEQGLISPIEFQTASNNYLEANAQKLNSQLTYFIKNSVVNYYNGVKYINQ